MLKLLELDLVVGSQMDDLENETEQTTKVWINLGEIREFYARKGNRRGTRISYKNGAGIAVSQLPDEVANAIHALNN